MIETCSKTQAFSLKGRLYTFTVLTILHNSHEMFQKHLNEVISQAPLLFNNAPIILDCTHINEKKFNLSLFCKILRNNGLIPVGIQKGNPEIESSAKKNGLAVLNSSATHDKSLPLKNFTPPAKAKFINSPLRSGQQIVSNADLIITASVSRGAELLADGHIHIYGALRGRALAGISGDKNARIFCHKLDAELISIAGFYSLSEKMANIESPCQIYLHDDHIQTKML